nr:MAG TPA: hypothetical protein [Caudoviricetes sp.]
MENKMSQCNVYLYYHLCFRQNCSVELGYFVFSTIFYSKIKCLI